MLPGFFVAQKCVVEMGFRGRLAALTNLLPLLPLLPLPYAVPGISLPSRPVWGCGPCDRGKGSSLDRGSCGLPVPDHTYSQGI